MFMISESLVSLAAGALTTLSPCVFPLLPLIVGGGLQGNRWAPVAMGLGMASAFAFFGILLGSAGAALGINPDVIRSVGAWLLLGFGIVMFIPALYAKVGLIMTPLASRANSISAASDASSIGGAFAIGALLGVVWTPCSGPMLGATVTMIAGGSADGGAVRGGVLMGLFGIGAAIPLVLVAYASRAGFGRARTWVLAHADIGRRLFGSLLIVLGALIITGLDRKLEAYITNLLPDWWHALTTML
jgi:cytochrome c-type biogenesis protein